MKKFLVTREFQVNFTDALKNDQLENWHNCRIEQVENIGQFLKSLKIQGYGFETSVICKHLCDNFSKFYTLFWQIEQSPKKNQFLRIGKFLSTLRSDRDEKDVIKEFNRKLIKYKQQKRWSKMFEYCKFYVDSILEQLRTQYHLDIRIEGDDGKFYYTFSDAEKKKNGRIKSEQFLNVHQRTGRHNWYPSKSLRERPRKIKESSVEASIVPKSINHSEIRRCRSAEQLSCFSQTSQEVKNFETKPDDLEAQELIIKETRGCSTVSVTLQNSEAPENILEDRIEQENLRKLGETRTFRALSIESVESDVTDNSFEMKLKAQEAEGAAKLLEAQSNRENTNFVKKELHKLINSF
ncbi:SPK domain-containing protein [Caenorhabditis elegans]|uniref:SPK domain-containing protein n=1 Tax=Caenorhabditis elegans TaxID=6239 RepID=O45974_CAEEL|nr:SPK domain-containing protein [Caenorhabditis elegans]CAA15968.2 SPK domain-containing protein [Caenorhabditis elegans]|eukprot:NP_506912.2 Uncharacterized protein CELE_Y6E2A.7 [Caenorhabditis elegans]